MEGILALCHFCETHGPCVILCTQRCKEEPVQTPHSLTVSWCDACQSVNLGQALVSRDSKTIFVTTRTPQQQDVAFLLKQAAVRSLSCEEETSKEGGTLYFGDSERGHVISHSFLLKDSLARGFHRKYSILMLMKDKVHLLNSWSMLVRHMKELSSELQSQAEAVNKVEQAKISQRAVRQAQGTPKNMSRSLPQITDQPAVFGHIHLWFTWILGLEPVVEKPTHGLALPKLYSPLLLRALSKQWDDTQLHKIIFCTLTGCRIVSTEADVVEAVQALLPYSWLVSSDAEICKVIRSYNGFLVSWSGILPTKLPTLQTAVEKALRNELLPDTAFEPYINSLILKWLHITQSLCWSGGLKNQQLLQVLGVQTHDMPVLNYWMYQCSA